jgi:hypothetical protein
MFSSDSRKLESLDDLARMLATPRRSQFRATKASVDSIARALISFRADGADSFFGRPAFDLATLETPQAGGAGLVSILAAQRLIASPDLYGAFLLWLLGDLYARAPEIGDVDAPRLVLIFDEAHLLFADATAVLLRRVEQTVRLIRSKGIGVYFATQAPGDIPPMIAAQLSNRVQHAMRAATLADQREIRGAADCLPTNPKVQAARLIATMPTGTALVSTLDSRGEPKPVDVVRVNAPSGRMGTLTIAERAPFRWAPQPGTSSPASSKVAAVRWRVLSGGAGLTALCATLHASPVALAAIAAVTMALAFARA